MAFYLGFPPIMQIYENVPVIFSRQMIALKRRCDEIFAYVQWMLMYDVKVHAKMNVNKETVMEKYMGHFDLWVYLFVIVSFLCVSLSEFPT